MTTATQERTGTQPLILAMLFFAFGQFVSPVFSALFGGSFTTSDRAGEPPLTPAGWTFSIWGLIEVVSVGLAIFLALRRKRTDADLIDRLAKPLLVVFIGFSAWILAAELEPVWSTLVIIVIMLAALLQTMRIVLAERSRIASWPWLGRALLWWTVGLYTGWLSVATWLNLTTAFAGSGAPDHRHPRYRRADRDVGRCPRHRADRPGLDRWTALVRGCRLLGSDRRDRGHQSGRAAGADRRRGRRSGGGGGHHRDHPPPQPVDLQRTPGLTVEHDRRYAQRPAAPRGGRPFVRRGVSDARRSSRRSGSWACSPGWTPRGP